MDISVVIFFIKFSNSCSILLVTALSGFTFTLFLNLHQKKKLFLNPPKRKYLPWKGSDSEGPYHLSELKF
jgi:hypothetical protein